MDGFHPFGSKLRHFSYSNHFHNSCVLFSFKGVLSGSDIVARGVGGGG